MKIAFISYDLGEYSIRHANALLAHGDVMLVLARQLAEPYEAMLDPEVDYRPFAKPRLRQPVQQLSKIRWILQQVEDYAPDVIHFQMGHLWFNFALPRLKRYPLVFTIHDPRHHVGDHGSRNTPQWVMDFGFRRADQVIVHGSQLQDVVQAATGFSRDRIQVIPHIAVGLDAAQQSTPPVDEDDTILFFGRIWEYKGLEYLIRAQPRISQRFPNVRIVIGGQGEDFARYRQLMADPTRFVVHNRWISDEERAQLFAAASVVVLPYIEATQSGVVPLAYAHGKPVVATRTGGLPDCVEHGKTGLLVPPRDEGALADAVISLLADPELCGAMGNAGRQKLADECSPDVVAAQTAEVYRLAIQQHRGGCKTTATQQDLSYSTSD